MVGLVKQLGEDFLRHDFTACRGVIDYLITDRQFSQERVIEFLMSVYRISEGHAVEVLDVLGFLH